MNHNLTTAVQTKAIKPDGNAFNVALTDAGTLDSDAFGIFGFGGFRALIALSTVANLAAVTVKVKSASTLGGAYTTIASTVLALPTDGSAANKLVILDVTRPTPSQAFFQIEITQTTANKALTVQSMVIEFYNAADEPCAKDATVIGQLVLATPA